MKDLHTMMPEEIRRFVELERAPYRVEVDNGGCECCEAHKTWTVVGPGAVSESESWEDREYADHVAERMNAAYQAGLAALRSVFERIARLDHVYEPERGSDQRPSMVVVMERWKQCTDAAKAAVIVLDRLATRMEQGE